MLTRINLKLQVKLFQALFVVLRPHKLIVCSPASARRLFALHS